MTIYWMGGEPDDFEDRYGSSGFQASGSRGYSRGLLVVNYAPAHVCRAWLRDANAALIPLTSFFFGVRLYTYGNWGGTYPLIMFHKKGQNLGTNGERAFLFLRLSGASGSPYQLCRYDESTGIVTVLATSTSPTFQQEQIVIQVENLGQANARCRVWHGSTNLNLVIDYTGTLHVGACTAVDGFSLGSSATDQQTTWQEAILCDEDPRTISVQTLVPSYTAPESAWQGGVDKIDEVPANDADVAYCETTDLDLVVGLGGMPAGNYIVKGVHAAGRFAKGLSGPGSVAMGFKITDPFTATHRAWRLRSIRPTYNGRCYVGRLEMRETSGGPDITQTAGGVALCSDFYGGFPASAAFDGANLNTAWCSNYDDGDGLRWVGWDFGVGNERTIREMVLWGWPNGPSYNFQPPLNGWIEYSDDLTNWTLAYLVGWLSWGTAQQESRVLTGPAAGFLSLGGDQAQDVAWKSGVRSGVLHTNPGSGNRFTYGDINALKLVVRARP